MSFTGSYTEVEPINARYLQSTDESSQGPPDQLRKIINWIITGVRSYNNPYNEKRSIQRLRTKPIAELPDVTIKKRTTHCFLFSAHGR